MHNRVLWDESPRLPRFPHGGRAAATHPAPGMRQGAHPEVRALSRAPA